jgi:hypothetical protein
VPKEVEDKRVQRQIVLLIPEGGGDASLTGI